MEKGTKLGVNLMRKSVKRKKKKEVLDLEVKNEAIVISDLGKLFKTLK